MKKFKEFIKSPHIQIALVTGICIIVLAWFSKRVFPEPIGNLPAAIPPLMMAVFEGFYTRFKDKKPLTTWYWLVGISLVTIVIILLHLS